MTWSSSDVDAVRNATFKSTSFLKRGYDMEQVDEFLDEVVDCMRSGGPLPDIRNTHFEERSGGYNEAEVDRFLSRIALHETGSRAPATVGSGGAATPTGAPPGGGDGTAGGDGSTTGPPQPRTHPVATAPGPEVSDITLTPVGPSDTPQLVSFLTTNKFPFHMKPHVDEEMARRWIKAGRFDSSESKTLWVDAALPGNGTVRLGLVVLEDLQDDTPLFDLRLAELYRGRGYARPALRAVTRLVFTTMPGVHRFEGQTREDNIAMRKTMLRCGFIKEAHYREAWPTGGDAHLATVAYAILRRDWESGLTTPVVWEDLDN